MTRWHANGQKADESHFKDGKLDGLATAWYENGQKEIETHYKNGKEEGLATKWHENGQKKLESHYQNDKMDGLWTKWYVNGQKASETHFKDGTRHGLETVWDDEGKVLSQRKYENGKLIASHTNHIEQSMFGLSKAEIKKQFGRPPDNVGVHDTWEYYGTFYDPDSEKFMKIVNFSFYNKKCNNVYFMLD